VDTIKLNGSMELAPSLSMCKRIVDLVSTGKTLKENGLKEVEKIIEVQSKLIINRSAFKTNTKKIEKIINEIKNFIL
jgi:ATP phosphoribosyltransferase